jgi:hypothetical protein
MKRTRYNVVIEHTTVLLGRARTLRGAYRVAHREYPAPSGSHIVVRDRDELFTVRHDLDTPPDSPA